MAVAMDWQPLVLFPSPNRRDVPIKISSDFLPGVEAVAPRVLVSLLRIGSCRHVTSSAARRGQLCHRPHPAQRHFWPVSRDERLYSSLLIARIVTPPLPCA